MAVGSPVRNVQALRGVACLLVVALHVSTWEAVFGIARPLLGWAHHFAYAGVDLFFVLSGFVIARTQARHFGTPAAIPGYLFRRAWRVYPTYLAALALTVMVFVVPNGWFLLPDDPGPLAKWSAWVTLFPTDVPHRYMPVAWTLPYELMFYAAFAVLLLVPRRVGPWLLVAWAVAVGVASVNAGWRDSCPAILKHLLSPMVWEFLIGCAAAWAVREGKVYPRWMGWAMAAAGVAWAAAGVAGFAEPGSPLALAGKLPLRVLTFGPAAALLVCGLTTTERAGGRTLPRWLQFVGDGSYSVYLWHMPAGTLLHAAVLERWDHTLLPHLGWLAAMAVVCVGGGLLFHVLVERPLLNLVKRGRAAAGPPASTPRALSPLRREPEPSVGLSLGVSE